MNEHQYFLRRPHLILAILIAVLIFILLTFAAARNWFRDEPLRNTLPDPVIAEPGLKNQNTTDQ